MKHMRYAWRICALLLVSALMFSSCTRDQDLDDTLAEGEDAWIMMTVNLPQTALPSASRSGQTEAESHISNLRILIFESEAGGYVFRYQAAGSEMESNAGSQRFKALLRSMDAPLKCIVLANAEDAFASYTPSVGETEANVRQRFELSFTASGIGPDLPMYGEVTMPNGLVAGTNSITVSMLRAVARVDVVTNLYADSDEFILTGVYVYRANDRIGLIPSSLADPASPKVDSPTIPAGTSHLTNPVSKIVYGGADSILQVYIPESAVVSTSDDRLRGTTVVVVGGRWGGAGNPVSYYRADFDPDLTGTYFGQVLRNHRYIFNIVRVSGPGWDNPQDAADNFSSSIDIEVVTWEDFSTDLYFGGDHFAVSRREVRLRYMVNREKRIDIESTVPYTIQWLDANGNPQDAGVSQQGVITRNDDFNASIVRDAGDPETVSHLLFSTRHDNYKGNVIERKLRVTAYTWTLDITVIQDNSAIFSDRHINVLSAYDNGWYPAGHLGTNTVYPSSSASSFTYGGLAMRMILEKQFAPTAEIRIGGFSFEQVNDDATYFNATTTANLATMERLIRLQDIINLTYAVDISEPVAKLVMDWLEGNPRHVLIVGVDTKDTNANMMKLLQSDGTWKFDHGSDGLYRGDGRTAEVNEFFSSPFGEVGLGVSFKRADSSFGYNESTISLPTPAVTLIKDNHNMMVFGVNMERRIIYNGDANLFMCDQLSNNNGNVTSDLDRLMANVWAWAVEQVIYGDD